MSEVSEASKPRVAVVGAGAFGKNHLRVIQQSEHAQLAYAEWTADGKLRQPAFLGLRTDKDPAECTWGQREP